MLMSVSLCVPSLSRALNLHHSGSDFQKAIIEQSENTLSTQGAISGHSVGIQRALREHSEP